MRIPSLRVSMRQRLADACGRPYAPVLARTNEARSPLPAIDLDTVITSARVAVLAAVLITPFKHSIPIMQVEQLPADARELGIDPLGDLPRTEPVVRASRSQTVFDLLANRRFPRHSPHCKALVWAA